MVAEVVSRHVDCTDDHGAVRAVGFGERMASYAVKTRIHTTKNADVKLLVGVLVLVFLEREHSLPPINVAVAEVPPGLSRANQRSEIRKIVGGVAQNVGRVQDGATNQRED